MQLAWCRIRTNVKPDELIYFPVLTAARAPTRAKGIWRTARRSVTSRRSSAGCAGPITLTASTCTQCRAQNSHPANTASHITMDTRHGVGISRPPRSCCLCVSLNRLFMMVPDACSPQGNGLRNERPISAGNRRRTRRMQHEDSIGCITGLPGKWFSPWSSERQKTFLFGTRRDSSKNPPDDELSTQAWGIETSKWIRSVRHGFPRQTLLRSPS